MPAPFEFPTTSTNLGLPYLFSGQVQKEFFVNQSLAVVDALMQQCIAASATTPPETLADGETYRVLSPATGEWEGEENSLAVRIGGAWHFVQPNEGSQVFDRSAGQFLVYKGQWEAANRPAPASGGAVIDTEARAVIDDLINELRRLGILP